MVLVQLLLVILLYLADINQDRTLFSSHVRRVNGLYCTGCISFNTDFYHSLEDEIGGGGWGGLRFGKGDRVCRKREQSRWIIMRNNTRTTFVLAPPPFFVVQLKSLYQTDSSCCSHLLRENMERVPGIWFKGLRSRFFGSRINWIHYNLMWFKITNKKGGTWDLLFSSSAILSLNVLYNV